MASGYNGTLYIGVTSQLFDRVMIHKHDLVDGFSKAHQIHVLVYYEMHATMDAAILREKQLKKWNRLWKIRLIEEMNPGWQDLFVEGEGILFLGKGGIAPRLG
ncbi:MAG: GIY-YIG nuclease family protein [Alphaproteobacteria bacterium]|nr:GIY-YIG nuclease family protein [Alphaproteobacteria bacterium]